MDLLRENFAEKWDAMRREYDAKADKLDAENRLDYNKSFDNFGEEVSAAADWTEASWREFTAKVDRQWQEMQIDRQTD